MTDPIAAPTVHLNGTSRDGLMDGYCKALSALAKARQALFETAPHMRDYYVQPDSDATYKKARDAHYARIAGLDQVIREIEALGEAVVNQEHGRGR